MKNFLGREHAHLQRRQSLSRVPEEGLAPRKRNILPIVAVRIARILKNAYMVCLGLRIEIGRAFVHASCFGPRDLGST